MIIDFRVPANRISNSTRPPSATEVADWIRERIGKGRFVPGQRLVEVDIIRQTGASRSKVREALQRLETESLVVIEEFRGASVRSAGLEEVRQIYRARVALEGISAHDFADNATETQKVRLQELQDELDNCVEERSPERFASLNRQWHELVVEGAGNVIVVELLQRLSLPIHRMLFESFYNEQRLRKANADHQAIVAAIMIGDAEGAERAMRRHVADGFVTLSVIDSEYHA